MTPYAGEEVAEEFLRRWNFHDCLGAADGKHVVIRCPGNSGAYYNNYKGFHSIILIAVVGADYKFLYVDISANGLCSNGVGFREAGLCIAVKAGQAGVQHHIPKTPIPFPISSWATMPSVCAPG